MLLLHCIKWYPTLSRGFTFSQSPAYETFQLFTRLTNFLNFSGGVIFQRTFLSTHFKEFLHTIQTVLQIMQWFPCYCLIYPQYFIFQLTLCFSSSDYLLHFKFFLFFLFRLFLCNLLRHINFLFIWIRNYNNLIQKYHLKSTAKSSINLLLSNKIKQFMS
jgi:hypothetical protein